MNYLTNYEVTKHEISLIKKQSSFTLKSELDKCMNFNKDLINTIKWKLKNIKTHT